jgi:hypothetical protein
MTIANLIRRVIDGVTVFFVNFYGKPTRGKNVFLSTSAWFVRIAPRYGEPMVT